MNEPAAVITPAPEATTTNGVTLELPNTTPSVEAPSVEFSSIIPESYADKAWVQDVKDIPGLFKMADDLKSKLGERAAGIPHENSTEEEKSSFNKAMGVPEKAEGYELSKPIEGHEDFQTRIKDLFLKANVSQNQAEALDAGWNDLMQQFAPDPEIQNADFDKMATEVFGDKKDTVLSNAKALLEAHSKDLPEGIKDAFNNLSNDILVPLAAVLNSIQGKYISEDDIPTGGGGAPAGASSEELRAEAVKIRSSEAWRDKFHEGHADAVARSEALYKRIAP